MQPTVNKTPRIEVIDALRGFAVMAILLVHSLEHFISNATIKRRREKFLAIAFFGG